MISYRSIAITIAVLFVSYAAVQELFRVRQVMPNPNLPTFHRVGTSDDPRYNKEDAYESDRDGVRDGLRRDVENTANNLLASPCNAYLRDQYIAAATKYARAWLSIAPCLEKCGSKERAQMELAIKAFNTPFDKTVRDLMRQVHNTDTIREGDFGQDVVVKVAGMASDWVLNPKADPAARKTMKENREQLSCRP
jgi:hypothetical protein